MGVGGLRSDFFYNESKSKLKKNTQLLLMLLQKVHASLFWFYLPVLLILRVIHTCIWFGKTCL